MRYMATYDLMETIRNTNQWLGASAAAFGSYPAVAALPNPYIQWLTAWGEVTERAFARMVAKPDWGIYSVVGSDGRDHVVSVEKLVERPFGDLIHFKVQGREPMPRRVFLVAPMSGHYATLLRSTVNSLLPDAEVYITDWHNARDIPVSEGKFDVEEYTLYLVDFMRALGPDINVIAVCQPAPLTLAATAYLAELDPEAQPQTLTLIGGPIDPDVAATEVHRFRLAGQHGPSRGNGDPAGGIQIQGRGPDGLPRAAATRGLHVDELRNPFQRLPEPDFGGDEGRGRRPRQAQQILRRIPRGDGHDRRVLPVDRRAHLQEPRDREERIRGQGPPGRHRQDHRRGDQDGRGLEGRYHRAGPMRRRAAAVHRRAGGEEGRLYRDRRRPSTAFSPASPGATTSARWCSSSSTRTPAPTPRRRRKSARRRRRNRC